MSKKVGRSFWWLWLIANILGNVLLPMLIWQDPYDLRSRIFINEILHGVGVSIAQTLVLRDRFARERLWFPLTLLGWTLGLIIVFFVPVLSLRQGQDLPSLSMLMIDFAIIGAIVGICQWQLLKSFRAAGLWLFASALSLSLSALGLYFGYLAQLIILGSALQGAIYGAIMGFTAIKVLRSPKVRR